MSNVWSQCLLELKAAYSADIFSIWFSDLVADESELESGHLTLFAASSIKARRTQESYGEKIEAIMSRLAGCAVTVHWTVRAATDVEAPSKLKTTLSEKASNSIDNTGILPNLSFENLVTGKANQMAYAAALQVANAKNTIYNPMIIYGGVGLGKTHLMHAIGRQFLQNHPNARVLCTTAQQYLVEFTHAMSSKDRETAMRNFLARYDRLDMLLIDDIQSFTDRQGTQANFFQVFEQMVPHGKQIVMTSDTFPRQLKDFQERLLSRITQGLMVEIEPPEMEMRVQILLQKAERCGLTLPTDVAEVIAKHLRSNVRELEGAVQQILAYVNFHHVPVTMDTTHEALRDLFHSSSTPVTVEAIQQATCEHYKLKIADMHSKKRSAPIAFARQVAMYLAKELTQKSLPEIGALFGGRDHTTVLYAHRKIASERSKNESLRHDLHLLEQLIKN